MVNFSNTRIKITKPVFCPMIEQFNWELVKDYGENKIFSSIGIADIERGLRGQLKEDSINAQLKEDSEA